MQRGETSYTSVGSDVQQAKWGGSVVIPTLVLSIFSISYPRQAERDLLSPQMLYKPMIERRLFAL